MNANHDYSPSPTFDQVTTTAVIPEWASFGFDNHKFSPSQLSRHFFILGETGSGKTVSGLWPILKATLEGFASERNLVPFVFVIDPKHELVAFLKRDKRWNKQLLELSLDRDHHKIDFFDGFDRENIDAERIIASVRDIFINPSREDKDRYWEEWAANFIKLIVQIDVDLHAKGKDFNKEYYASAQRTVESGTLEFGNMSPADFVALCENRGVKGEALDEVYFERVSQFVGLVNADRILAFKVLEGVISSNELAPSFIDEFAPLISMHMETFGSISSFVTKSLNRLSSRQINRHVWFCPYKEAPNGISIDDLMDTGKIVVFHPSLANVDSSAIVAKCIKTKIFETVFYRKNKERPILYVCDEFQRFITSDPVSGEQSFLDRCRAYRTICILATQSISSLAYAIGSGEQNRISTSLDIIMTNTGNKLFFRSTDDMVGDKLSRLIPRPSLLNKAHILSVRPASTLTVGECYFVFSSGKWGRKRVNIDDG